MFQHKLSSSREILTNRLILLSTIACSALLIAVSGHTGFWVMSKHEDGRSSSPRPAYSGHASEVEIITITPEGFEPHEIVRPAGPFILAVTNRSGIDSLMVQLETEQHGKVREKSLPLKTPRWREVINLPTGRYTMTEYNHPEWTFSLTIQ